MLSPLLSPLRSARLHAGLTQFVLAQRAGLSAARISMLERGHDDARPEERAALSRVLRVPSEALFVAAAKQDAAPGSDSPTHAPTVQ